MITRIVLHIRVACATGHVWKHVCGICREFKPYRVNALALAVFTARSQS